MLYIVEYYPKYFQDTRGILKQRIVDPTEKNKVNKVNKFNRLCQEETSWGLTELGNTDTKFSRTT